MFDVRTRGVGGESPSILDYCFTPRKSRTLILMKVLDSATVESLPAFQSLDAENEFGLKTVNGLSA